MTSTIQNIIKTLDKVLEEFYKEYDGIATVLYLDGRYNQGTITETQRSRLMERKKFIEDALVVINEYQVSLLCET